MKQKEEDAGPDTRLEQIDILGFRSCVETTFYPNRELSALIGVNGAGKTNILQAIRLLQPRRPGYHFKGGREQIRDRRTASEVTAWFRVGEARIGLRMQFSVVEGRRSDELMPISETWNLHGLTDSKAWKAIPPVDFFAASGKRLRIEDRDQQIRLEAELRYMFNDELRYDFEVLKNESVVEAMESILRLRRGISYYSASQFTDPSRCPSSFEVDEEGRLSDAYSTTTHLKFLYDLYRLKASNSALYAQYCLFVSRKQLGLISRITWKEIELSSFVAEVKSQGQVKKIRKRKTLVIPKVQVGSSYITFNQLSEGTFKTLALVFYIITDESKFLMVEEPEVCVHHGLLTRVVDTLHAYSKIKQTVLSTHSDLLVDDLLPENVFVVELAKRGTRVTQLGKWLGKREKAALHDYLAESGSLGDYWRSGGLS